jgi:hypothetical protein
MTAYRRVDQKSGATLSAFPLFNTRRFPNTYGRSGGFGDVATIWPSESSDRPIAALAFMEGRFRAEILNAGCDQNQAI